MNAFLFLLSKFVCWRKVKTLRWKRWLQTKHMDICNHNDTPSRLWIDTLCTSVHMKRMHDSSNECHEFWSSELISWLNSWFVVSYRLCVFSRSFVWDVYAEMEGNQGFSTCYISLHVVDCVSSLSFNLISMLLIKYIVYIYQYTD